MQFGMNLMLWTANPDASHAELLGQLRGFGYDLVELPIFAPANFPVADIKKLLDDNGLGAIGCSALPGDASLISADAGEAQRGMDFLKGSMDVCSQLGAKVLCGPLYHPVGSFTGVAPTQDERSRYIERMQQLGEHAQQANVKLAVEPLNRFETHFLNLLSDAAATTRAINHPFVGIHSDTFHQGIEEQDSSKAWVENKDQIIHVHASENHRGTPGKGQVRWDDWAQTLKAHNYDGAVVIESFGSGLPELAAATRVWRDLTGDPLVLAREGLNFVKSKFA
ncbi:MAG TPA: sugar phosphate isomerase/epimerase family protein [Abditibacteriaceae bacterium]